METAACSICLIGGSRDETKKTTGVTHLFEHMLFRRTKNMSTNAIACAIDNLGGDINAFTSTNSLCLVGNVPRRRVFKLLDFFSELLLNAVFHKQDLEIEKEIVRQEILEANDDPFENASHLFNEKFWPGSGLGLPVFGTVDVVAKCTSEAMKRRLAELLVGKRIIIGVVGDLSFKELVSHVEETFGALQKGRAFAPKAPQTGYGVHLLPRPVHQSYVILGRRWPATCEKDYLCGAVLSTLLGETMSSRLFQLVREKHGLAYSIASDVDAHADTACLSITAVLEKGNLEMALQDICQELVKLSAGKISEEEYQRGIEFISSQLQMSADSLSSRLWRAIETEIHYGRYVSPTEVIQKLNQTGLSEIQRVSRKWFSLKEFLLIIGGNVKGVKLSKEMKALCS